MKKLLYFLFAVIGSFGVYRIANLYWMLAFLGLWLAFGITLLKLHLGDALRLWGIVLGACWAGRLSLTKSGVNWQREYGFLAVLCCYSFFRIHSDG